ncbi:MAG: UvrD-helicase domain-containing protein [Clostridia bacterium]|nr:UvrD-helicase domain-containing protein [Clostridia bacterium]
MYTPLDLSKLNGPQREAVTCTEGPLLVLAGAGSGKTRVLTHRIAYLISEKDVLPWNILALTFTNKAAGEMRERVENLVGPAGSGDMWVLTFHSFCVRILRREIDRLGYDPKFVIYDDTDQQTLVRHVIKDMNLDDKVFTPRQLAAQFSSAKNHMPHDPAGFLRESGAIRQVTEAFSVYEKYLRKNNALDFDDLLLKTVELFEKEPEVLEKYRLRFRYILVDEYQDTNLAQYEIVRLLAGVHRNLCVVGDDDQSIYGWRGADIRNILEFEKDFPGARVIRLEQNYRSTGNILEAANLVISNNRGRKPKKLWTERKGGDPVGLFIAEDDRDEAQNICRTILSETRRGRSWADFAVLYRTHAQSRMLEMYLKSYDIPYRVYGGVSFFQRAEVKDLLAYLRLLENPHDDVSFRRAVNTPKRGLGDGAISLLESKAAEMNSSLLAAALKLQDEPSRYAAKLKQFCGVLSGALGMLGLSPISEITEWLLGEIRYEDYLRDDKKENFETRLEIVNELVSYMAEFEESLPAEEVSDPLQAFLENVALFTSTDELDSSAGQVTLMTLHSAKGLEFPVVFLCGLEQGLFPSEKCRYDPERMEEERRLCYVGITRAMDTLHLSYARERMNFGRIEPSVPSVFLDELEPVLPDQPAGKRSRRAPAGGFGSPFQTQAGYSFYSSPSPSSGDMHTLKKPAPAGPKPAQPVSVELKPPAFAFKPGQRVSHAKYGTGTILSMSGSGGGQILEIDFDSGQVKKFSASMAPITPLED